MSFFSLNNHIFDPHNPINYILRPFVSDTSFGKKCIASKPSESVRG